MTSRLDFADFVLKMKTKSAKSTNEVDEVDEVDEIDEVDEVDEIDEVRANVGTFSARRGIQILENLLPRALLAPLRSAPSPAPRRDASSRHQ